MNTAHGAYMSGIRAAEQVMSGYCIQQAEKEKEEKRKKKMEKKKKDKGKKKEEESEDDDEEDEDTGSEEEEEEMEMPSKPKKSKERIILSEERRKKAQERDELWVKVGKILLYEWGDIDGSVSSYSVIHNWEGFITLRIVKVCSCSLHVYINVISF